VREGGVCRKFESFVGALGGFAPPPPAPAGKSEFPTLQVLNTVPYAISHEIEAEETI
jgi:hypothetical protein